MPASTSFTFTLSNSARVSAGVYITDGTLIKTLWSGIFYKAGTHTGTWDGTDDQGRRVADANYTIRVLSNNVTYTWEGVIGNTSDSLTGSKVLRSLQGIAGMAISGNTAYIATHYNEGSPAQLKIHLNNPQIRQPLFLDHTGTGQNTTFVATDDNKVYWAGFDPFQPTRSFVWASQVSNDAEVKFAKGQTQSTTWGRTYSSAISAVDALGSVPTGLAVQKKGSFLFVSRKKLNKLYVLHKINGALIKTLTITDVGLLAVDNTDRLWVQTGGKLTKYKVNSIGTLSRTGVSVSGLADPQGLAASHNGALVVVADGGNSQQLKAFSNVTGAAAWTYGQAGGYATNATVNNSKFYFNDPSQNVAGSFIAFQSNNSFWVGDTGNRRAQHYSANRNYIKRIMYLPGFYSCTVDKNNPSRVFANYLEFKVDYSKPLAATNGSWQLTKNWGYFLKNTLSNVDNKSLINLQFVHTLKNNRTYGFLPTPKNKYQIVELVPGARIRFTGIELDRSYQLYADGSLRKISGETKENSILTWSKKILMGFDTTKNPIWGIEKTIASSPPITSEDPVVGGHVVRTGETTSSGIVVAFDGGAAG
ncbi:FlgD immunoglobulin-like domain containing protein [Adhaeribacter pallidiroseus]|uniref:FlgD immunoglobulin-like domain containing protein n=1 Tax=Adhaeribacter pallidiroseus TaxID=2072847 RepID=UPI001314AE0D|nr:FlgD immunoglobulin-like domain containing protein [Adhaeribacter pallidiroseus]